MVGKGEEQGGRGGTRRLKGRGERDWGRAGRLGRDLAGFDRGRLEEMGEREETEQSSR